MSLELPLRAWDALRDWLSGRSRLTFRLPRIQISCVGTYATGCGWKLNPLTFTFSVTNHSNRANSLVSVALAFLFDEQHCMWCTSEFRFNGMDHGQLTPIELPPHRAVTLTLKQTERFPETIAWTAKTWAIKEDHPGREARFRLIADDQWGKKWLIDFTHHHEVSQQRAAGKLRRLWRRVWTKVGKKRAGQNNKGAEPG